MYAACIFNTTPRSRTVYVVYSTTCSVRLAVYDMHCVWSAVYDVECLPCASKSVFRAVYDVHCTAYVKCLTRRRQWVNGYRSR